MSELILFHSLQVSGMLLEHYIYTVSLTTSLRRFPVLCVEQLIHHSLPAPLDGRTWQGGTLRLGCLLAHLDIVSSHFTGGDVQAREETTPPAQGSKPQTF